MPTLNTTSSNAFRYPTSTNNGADFATGIADLASDVDGMWLQGTLASLPSPTKRGRRYYATDIGQELADTGSSWIPVGSATPIGAMTQYAGSADPLDADGTTRWLICDGRAISRTTYAALFGRVSTTYGAGDGTTTFNIPDLRGRVAVGADSGGVHLPSNHPALGGGGGEEKHTLSNAELPALGQFPAAPNGWSEEALQVGASINTSFGTPYTTGQSGTIINTAIGSGTAHNNLQPYLAVNHIIKVL